MIIRAKAPLRLSFAGGGTDVSPYSDTKGGAVLNATINKHAFATLVTRKDGVMNIRSLDYGIAADFRVDQKLLFNGEMDLAKGVIRKLHNRKDGFDLYTHSDAPPGSGLGSSSTMVVALIGAFREWRMIPLGDYDTARLAYEIERKDIGIQGGKQDQFAAAFGGFNFMEFEGEQVVINPLRVKPEVVNELQYNMLLCYTGGTRLSANIIDSQVRNFVSGKKGTAQAMDRLKQAAVDMKRALLTGKLDDFGKLLDYGWQQKKRMSDRISTPTIDEMYEEARKAGAIGGKITGAGGGGFLMVYCRFDKKHKVAERLEKLGGEIVDFQFEEKGLQTWRIAQ
ncbi:MAG: dehydrogenase [Deltaproteobacteria bacterium]|nr:dehydrogenase [Deltaproteobacteria bacterium]MBP2689370.1 dehydrogenase [Deltaproteobacteria bacterium]